ncbi:bifunctional diaminohydroxyphosphoribosylaminopyrimidine deaminase/5-amino-6-(5-phosphoribosylamino)uracil reductase RibD [Paenalkalicoccus suaedae]|uniref:Riboflavin biosynthesis protein RibD n=1 Tax=Paenalkalicoccus suaedae TaxID=2592382 RepID=A0A859FK89_9BACI|nr:bifunctional diaminohydroxyphosphoribosylaminopyrimidine deaminase/5-amino-6-(5-phosphoribosylamino)uracil reductase RibD [Paenalkalicoccus suaedae]QKS73221.1 bifunctional diaminohydroxyphosphoribosylaminopyrimidine deaminase/5-amino-6-(5-phosphoribosylamino)uracil reductase RibD [Paenalkalicoccus suaedae]
MSHDTYMQVAIDLASITHGQTSPNPLVGCIIVKNGEVVGMGAHLKAGMEHAERHALAMAKEKAKGATLYCTLEPCSHTGRTSPCADAIVDAGVAKVIIASDDPNPKVAGNGIKRLRDAGIEVISGVLKEKADELNHGFFYHVMNKKPFVTLKMATSIDGKIATKHNESKWITSEEARLDGHKLRHQHDAILVGIETAIKDDPSLTTRLPEGGKNPIRVVLDRTLRISEDAKVLNDDAPSIIFTTNDVSEQKVERVKSKTTLVIQLEELSIDAILHSLYKNNVTSVLIEGGGTIHDSFIRSGYFNQVIHYQAPLLIGGREAPSAVSGTGIEALNDAPRLKLVSVDQIGPDIKAVYMREEER